MSFGKRTAPIAFTPAQEAEMMEKYGIARGAADCFTYGEYRYTHLKDAVEHAQREFGTWIFSARAP